jgi:hypothetical protein
VIVPRASALVHALTDPATTAGLDEGAWSALVGAARAANLLGALAARCRACGVTPPLRPRRHLDGALQLASRQRLSVRWEAQLLAERFAELGHPVVLLKGAAYVLSGEALAEGRMFGDIDILVPRRALGEVEKRLMLGGWVSAKSDPYDQRYYRQWMHELPPMVHIRRGTVLDVHHDILPATAGRSTDPTGIIERATPVADLPALSLPSPEDLVVHSLTHLMHEGELHSGLRDLFDVHQLIARFGARQGFWTRFRRIALAGDLSRPVCWGLHLAHAVFGTDVPPDVMAALRESAPIPRWLEPVYRRALEPAFGLEACAAANAARLLLYLRAHRLRMPWPLLLRHLSAKSLRALAPERSAAQRGDGHPAA